MIAKKRKNIEQTSRRNNFIFSGILGVFIVALAIALISSDFVRKHIPIIILSFLFSGIILIFLTMTRDGPKQDSTRVPRRGSAIQSKKEKNLNHYATLDQGVQEDSLISSDQVQTGNHSNEKSGKGSIGTIKSSSSQTKPVMNRGSPPSKKKEENSEKEETSLFPDEKQDNTPTPAPKELWNFPRELLDRYEPLGVLGDDAYAQVYLVRNKKNDTIRSLKLSKSTEPASEIVKKESSIWQTLKHPNIATLYASQFDQFKFLEIEYVPGVLYKGERYFSLSELPKPINEKYAVSFVLDIARALIYTHNLGLRHYHLQPGNILITPQLKAKVSGYTRGKNEFGFATGYATIGAQPEFNERLIYIAPEQREESDETLSTRTDLYQVGIIFYELLTGYKPYTKRLYEHVYPEITERNMSDVYAFLFIPPSHIASAFAPYDHVLQQLIALEKKERYSSVKDLVADLKAIQNTFV